MKKILWKHIVLTALGLQILLGWFTEVSARPVTIAITATVRMVFDPGHLFNGVAQTGDTITGTYTYDTESVDANPLETVADYWHASAPYGITLNLNGLEFRTDPSKVDFLLEVADNFVIRYETGPTIIDFYVLQSYNNIFAISPPPGRFHSLVDNHISLQLDDPTAQALMAITPPTVPLHLEDWPPSFGLEISSVGGENSFLVRAEISSAVLVPQDADGDGVEDAEDGCAGTSAGSVVNTLGCGIEQLVPCVGSASGKRWKSHLQYLLAVTAVARDFRVAGLISKKDMRLVIREAAYSRCGRREVF